MAPVTTQGMAFLAMCGLLPRISRGDILDKSTSDNLTKIRSVLQALWMLVQTVRRLIVDLPVTLLEFNTWAHIVCAMVSHVLCWNNPN